MPTIGRLENRKKKLKKIIFFMLLSLIWACSASTRLVGVSLDWTTASAPLYVHDIKKACTQLTNGHGPYLWCAKRADEKKEAWFWFVPRKNVDSDDFEIAFITEGMTDNPDSQVVIWPKELRGKALDQVYRSVYGDVVK